MGGKLFKGKSVPMNRVEHDIIQKEILNIISNALEIDRYKIEEVKFMKDKTSFNDIDFIFDYYRAKLNNNPLIDLISFESNLFSNIFHNGPIISCLYKEKYHIDFMLVEYKNEEKKPIPFSNFISMQYYYDYEMGNFLGKIAKRFNCTLKPSGLYLTARNLVTNEKFENKNIFLTNDIEKISNFLGYSISKYFEGFETENNFFEYLGTSKNFNARFYVADELSKSTSRLRDIKRPKYQRFLEYYNLVYNRDRKSKDSTTFKLPYKYCIERCERFNLMNNSEIIFEQLNKINLFNELLRLNSYKFNGNICIEITGLKDKELGNFIYCYKEYIGNDNNFLFFVQYNDSKTIRDSILNFYDNVYKHT